MQWQIFLFLGSKIIVDNDCSHEIKRHLLLGKKAMTNLNSIKKQRHYFANKGLYIRAMVFPVVDHKEDWVPKNWCFQTVVLKKTLESSLDSKDIKPVNSKGNQSWIFTRRPDAEAETPILWLLDAKSQLTGKVSDAGKDWGQENGMREWDG